MRKLLVVLTILVGLLSGCIGGDDMTHISTLEQLQAMKDNLSEDYILDNDIDASPTSGWNGGTGFEPVGNYDNHFTGSFDGQGHKITNLYINRPATNYVGLFGVVDMSKEIKNLTPEDWNITGAGGIACLIGWTYGTAPKISGVTVSGELNAPSQVGGLIGMDTTDGMDISNCHSNITISSGGTGHHSKIGGLIGEAWDNVTFTKCSAIVSITTTDAVDEYKDISHIGGLIGCCSGSGCKISKSFAKGSITGGNSNDNIVWIAGLIGAPGSNTDISDSYAQVDIKVGNAINVLGDMGGFIGLVYGTCVNCYSTGKIEYGTGGTVTSIGGFSGYVNDPATNCFWDTESSGMSESAAGTGKTTAEMKTKSTFTNWDFDTIWGICEAPSYVATYPWLQWEAIECEAVDREAPWKEDILTGIEGTFEGDDWNGAFGIAKVEIPRRSGNWIQLGDIMRIHTSRGKDASSPRVPIEIGQAEITVSNISKKFNSLEEASEWYKSLEGYAMQIWLGFTIQK